MMHHVSADFKQVTGCILQNCHFLPLTENVSQHQLKLKLYEEVTMRGSDEGCGRTILPGVGLFACP